MLTIWESFSLMDKAALIGLLGLLIPVLIHLFNPTKGTMIPIGNINFIKHARQFKVNELKLRQWILLLLRSVIIILVTLVIAQLVKNTFVNNVDKNHVYIGLDWLKFASPSEISSLQLMHQEDEIFLLQKDFPKVSLAGLEKINNEVSAQSGIEWVSEKNNNLPTNNFALIEELRIRKIAPENSFFYLTNKLKNLPGKQYFVNQSFELKVKSLDEEAEPEQPIKLSVIFDTARIADKMILEAAFDTLPKRIKSSFQLKFYSLDFIDPNKPTQEHPESNDKSDWIFWLSEKPVEQWVYSSLNMGGALLIDSETSSVSKNNIHRVYIENVLVLFFGEGTSQHSNLVSPVWRSAEGKLFLAKEHGAKFNIFHFPSRFNPEWTNMVEKKDFPIILANLISNSRAFMQGELVAASEIKSMNLLVEESLPATRSLGSVLIFLLTLLWLIERWIAERKRTGDV